RCGRSAARSTPEIDSTRERVRMAEPEQSGDADPLDLDTAQVPPGAGGEPGPRVPPPGALVPFDPNPARETVRGLIAKWLILILAALVTAPFWFIAWRSDQANAVKEILQIVFGPVVALVGSVIGFYFGVERAGTTGNAGTPPGGKNAAAKP